MSETQKLKTNKLLLDSSLLPPRGKSVYLQLEHHLHPVPTQRADVIQNKSRDYVNPVGLMGHYTCLRKRQKRQTCLWTEHQK